MATVTTPLSPCFVPRRRFPWNIILLSIFVSGLGLVGGDTGGAPMAPQLPRWVGRDRGMCGQAGGSQEPLPPTVLLILLSTPFFSPVDAGHGADDRDDRQVHARDPVVTGAGVPSVPCHMAGSNERLPGARGHPGPFGLGTAGSLPGIRGVGGLPMPPWQGDTKAWGDSGVPSIHSMYRTNAVLIAMLITAIVAIIVTIFCFQTKARRGTYPASPWGVSGVGSQAVGDSPGPPMTYMCVPSGRLILHRVQGSSAC